MKIYLVGGAVRDKLLKLDIRDKDWVVVGSSYKKMLNLGFIPIGNDFPVFLHPITHEEYALARKEKKVDKGYKGFLCNFSKKISLKEDLYRRDLTINAIAYRKGIYYDFFGGINDIKNRIIRHVSPYFSDDPLRVLRVIKIYSFYSKLGFYIHKKTFQLIKKVVNSGELLYIKPERIWLETKKVFSKGNLFIYFNLINLFNIDKFIYPEIYNIFNKKKIKKYFKLLFNNYSNYKLGLKINLFCLFIFFGDSIFSKKYFFYKNYTLNTILNFCNRLKLPKKFFSIFKYIYFFLYKIFFIKNKILSILFLNLLNIINIWRNPKILTYLCKFIKVVNLLLKNKILFFLDKYIYIIYIITNSIKSKYLIKLGYKGIFIRKYIRYIRYKKIYFFLKNLYFK